MISHSYNEIIESHYDYVTEDFLITWEMLLIFPINVNRKK